MAPNPKSLMPTVNGISEADADGDHTVLVVDPKGREVACRLPAGHVHGFRMMLSGRMPDGRPTPNTKARTLKRGEARPIGTLTVIAHQVVLNPDGAKALVLQTLEEGTVAFALSDDDKIRKMAGELAELAAVSRLTGPAH